MPNFRTNTNITENGKSETVTSSVALCEPQLEHVGGSLTEEFIEGRHFVCAIDEVNYEHVRGFPVEIDLEGPPRDDNEDSGYVPTLSMKEMKSCSQIWKKGKKSFLKNLNQIFQKILKNHSC